MNLLEVKDLTVMNASGYLLFSNLNFNIPPSHCIVLKGKNGAGKSTLLKTLVGLHPYKDGSIQCNVEKNKIAFLPQSQNQVCHLPFFIHDILSFNEKKYDFPEIDSIGLLSREHLKKSWNRASGGERQRTLITKILLEKPQLIFLDEPFNHLDLDSQAALVNSLKNYLEKNPKSALIIISHEENIPNITKPENIKEVYI